MRGGCIGVTFNEKFEVEHTVAANTIERNKFRGSKYVQSEMNDVQKQIKKLLQDNKKVLFTGTPCQVGAVKQFLNALNINIDNLITNDVVCHGSPSPAVWNDYVKYIEKYYGGKLVEYSFRDKKMGWRGYHIKAKFDNGSVIEDSKVLRSFAEIFSMDLMIRPSCFYCPYASLERSGDITIGDFWGIEKVDSSFSDNEGISLVLCNNHEGENFYDISKKTGQRKDKKYSSSVLTQPNLYKPTDFGEEYDSFWHDYKKHGFKRIAAKYGKIGVFGKIFYYKRAIKYRLQK